MTKYICESEYCEKELDEDLDLDTIVLAWYDGMENFRCREPTETHCFCSFKCAANYMQQAEYG